MFYTFLSSNLASVPGFTVYCYTQTVSHLETVTQLCIWDAAFISEFQETSSQAIHCPLSTAFSFCCQ